MDGTRLSTASIKEPSSFTNATALNSSDQEQDLSLGKVSKFVAKWTALGAASGAITNLLCNKIFGDPVIGTLAVLSPTGLTDAVILRLPNDFRQISNCTLLGATTSLVASTVFPVIFFSSLFAMDRGVAMLDPSTTMPSTEATKDENQVSGKQAITLLATSGLSLALALKASGLIHGALENFVPDDYHCHYVDNVFDTPKVFMFGMALPLITYLTASKLQNYFLRLGQSVFPSSRNDSHKETAKKV